jgi:uncharacterized protein
MQIPLVMLLVLGAVGHVVFWVAIVNRLHGLGINRLAVNALTLLCAIALAAIPPLATVAVLPGLLDREALVSEAVTSMMWTYLIGCTAVAIVATAQRAYWLFHAERRDLLLANHTTRIDFSAKPTAVLTAPGIPYLLSRLPGNEALTILVQEKRLAIPRWIAGAGRMRIAHLSDLHMSGRITRCYFERVVEEVNCCEPDLIALTGDLIERPMCLDWVPETLGRLRAPGGIYFVLGNHDRHAGAAQVIAALEAAGLMHLGGKWRRLCIGNTPLILAGNELPWFPPAADISDCPPRDANGLPLRIVLAHSPDQFRWAQANDVDLLLAGHVHGGQVCLPVLGPILAPSFHGVRYAGGMFRGRDTVLHVSRGTSSLTPLRWNCPPEIAILDLQPAAASKAD